MQVISDGYLSIQHIMWQPQFNCSLKCEGCYLRGTRFDSAFQEEPLPLNTDILNLIYQEGKVGCQQFTISLDTSFSPDTDLTKTLMALWQQYQTTEEPLPELCVTTRDWNNLLRWAGAMGMTPRQFVKPLTILSLSAFPVLGKHWEDINEVCKQADTILNYNRVVRKDITNKEFGIGTRYADQVYLVLDKSPLGVGQHSQAIIDHSKVLIELQNQYPDRIFRDSCLGDAEAHVFGEKKTMCGAGITKVSVWPDGSVTGCPYDSMHVVHDHEEVFDTWTQLQKVVSKEDKHPMEYCGIVKTIEAIKSFKKSQKEVELSPTTG